MIEREIRKTLEDMTDIYLPLKDILLMEEINELEYGAEGEIDHEAANGYVLEMIIRRKCTK